MAQNEIEKRLRKRRLEVEEFDRQILRLEFEKGKSLAVINELELILRTMPKAGKQDERQLRVGTDVYNARKELQKERHALYIKDLVEKIGGDTGRNRRSSLSAQLAAYARKGEIFTKEGPNVYGLLDYGPEPTSTEEAIQYEIEDAFTETGDDWEPPF